jgi:glycosyltransferase involved in cell wall biosynthesis
VRKRVAIVFGDGHLDHDLAFIEIIAKHCDVLICGPTTTTTMPLAGLGVEQVLLFRWPRHRQVLGSLALLARLSLGIRRFKPDLVHVLSEGQVWLNLLPTLLKPIPLVVTLHDVTAHPGDTDTAKVPRGLINAFVRQAQAVIVHGQGLKAAAVAQLGLAPERVFVGVHPPINRYRDIALGTAGGPALGKPHDGVLRLLFFGRVMAYKGLAHLIDAEPLIADDLAPYKITIAGRGDDMGGYLARMQRPDRFDVRDRRIPDDETARLFAESDVLILPYVEASQSGVLAIAAAFGLPVIASDVGEIGALVRETGMGLLVPPGDPGALALAITQLGRDRALRERLSDAARAALVGALGEPAVWSKVEPAYDFVSRTSRPR